MKLCCKSNRPTISLFHKFTSVTKNLRPQSVLIEPAKKNDGERAMNQNLSHYTTSSQLSELIRAQFPLVFGKQIVPIDELTPAYNGMAEYIARTAEPPLKPETHKQQTSVTVSSIGLIALILFNVKDIKMPLLQIDVNNSVIAWYLMFVSVMLSVFLMRVLLDNKRAALIGEKDAEKLHTLQDLVALGQARSNIQLYYTALLCDEIGERYGVYSQIRNPSAQPFENIRSPLDHSYVQSMKKLDEFREEIKTHSLFVEARLAELDRDIKRFEDRMLKYDNREQTSESHTQEFQRDTKVMEYYKKYIDIWFDARRELSTEMLKSVTEEDAQQGTRILDAQLELLKRARTLRRLYVFTEIILPTAIAIGAVVYGAKTIKAYLISLIF